MDILSLSKKDIKKFVKKNQTPIYYHLIPHTNYEFLKDKPMDLVVEIVSSLLIGLKDYKQKYKKYNSELIKLLEKLKI